jgi:hypothetical protein
MMDKYRFKFGKDESGKYVDEYKNGNKVPLIPDINNIEWVKYSDVKDLLKSKCRINPETKSIVLSDLDKVFLSEKTIDAIEFI